MGRQIVKQPDGLYSVYSSIVDNFTCMDCTKEQLIDYFFEIEKERIIEYVNTTIEELKTGKRKSQFTKTYKDCIKTIDSIHKERWWEIK